LICRNIWDCYLKSCKTLKEAKKSSVGASKMRKYVYRDELKFLSKLISERQTDDATSGWYNWTNLLWQNMASITATEFYYKILRYFPPNPDIWTASLQKLLRCICTLTTSIERMVSAIPGNPSDDDYNQPTAPLPPLSVLEFYLFCADSPSSYHTLDPSSPSSSLNSYLHIYLTDTPSCTPTRYPCTGSQYQPTKGLTRASRPVEVAHETATKSAKRIVPNSLQLGAFRLPRLRFYRDFPQL
jgi:hypothetical protein